MENHYKYAKAAQVGVTGIDLVNKPAVNIWRHNLRHAASQHTNTMDWKSKWYI